MQPGIGILVGTRGPGSNMAALVEACASGRLDAQVRVVVGTTGTAPAMARARELGVRTVVVEPGEDYSTRLQGVLSGCRVVCLAGYMRLLPAAVLQTFAGRMLNIHPALLPKFGGKGMYGLRVHAAVLAAGETESGCTVHIVTEEYDEGPIVLQKRCPVLPDDTPESLAARVLVLEHEAFPEAVQVLLSQS